MRRETIIRNGLSETAALKAREELGETEERKAECLAQLRYLVACGCTENELPEKYQDVNDCYLLRFLRAKKYDVESSYKQIKDYERFLKKYNVWEKVDDKSVVKRLAQCQPGVLTTRDEQGQVALLFKIKDWNPSEYSFSDCVATYVHIIDRLLQSEDTQVNGITIIQNFEGYTMKQMLGVGLFEYKQMVDMLQGSVPLRFKGVFCLNQPSFFVKIFNLIKVFLGEKLKSRIHVYGKNTENLFEHFAKETIPSDFGGDAPAYDGHAVAELLLNNNL